MKKFIHILFIGLLIVSCKQTVNNEPPTTDDTKNTPQPTSNILKPEQFYGEWRNVSMEITTAYNTSSSKIESYKEENWEKDLKIKPIRTYYKTDGTYLSEYRDLEGVVFSTTSGKWLVKQDSVYLNQIKPETRVAAYYVEFHDDDTATFTALLDWTSNGKKDDLYIGKQERAGE